MPILADSEFLTNFWQYDQVTYFRLGQKTKSDFIHKRMNSYLLSNPFFGAEKGAAVKSVFPESSTFSKTIFDFLVRFPAILLSEQGAH